MIASILLSAGLSRRYGSPKALAKLNGETVIERLQKVVIQSPVEEMIVVLGADADEIKPHLLNHNKIKFVYNKDYNLGQTSSFKAGLRSISKWVKGILLIPVDHPFIQPGTIDLLIRYYLKHFPLIVLPAFEGRKGHPPLFSADLKEEFLALDNGIGLNAIAHAHQNETVILPVEDAGVIQSFNTKEEFRDLRQQHPH
ncbi:MAG: nucleotidyltransferase family protein [Candidatus Omnitrophica bacterium]|nr:nucleotidyltransferase family protein [Candidatus Omnitrophota bacterium]